MRPRNLEFPAPAHGTIRNRDHIFLGPRPLATFPDNAQTGKQETNGRYAPVRFDSYFSAPFYCVRLGKWLFARLVDFRVLPLRFPAFRVRRTSEYAFFFFRVFRGAPFFRFFIC